MDYTIWNVALIVLLPFFAFAINAFIVKKYTKTAVAISCAAMLGSAVLATRIFWDFWKILGVIFGGLFFGLLKVF